MNRNSWRARNLNHNAGVLQQPDDRRFRAGRLNGGLLFLANDS